ncbi:hypothetical protein Tco_0212193 [Tanacetum coccineum]
MVMMVPYEAFACRCEKGDVILRQAYITENYGKLYYACPKSKPPKHFGCGFFLWKEDQLRDLMSSPGAPSAEPSTPSRYSSVPSTPPSYSSGPSTPQIYSPGSSRNAECSNCKQLRGRISVLKVTMEMHMHPEQHTLNSGALLHEVLNEMEKLDLEAFDNDGKLVVLGLLWKGIVKWKLVLMKLLNPIGFSTSGKDESDKGYGTNSLLEQWRDSYPDNDDYDPYDDDMYENHDLSEHLQSICDDLDITVRGRKKK